MRSSEVVPIRLNWKDFKQRRVLEWLEPVRSRKGKPFEPNLNDNGKPASVKEMIVTAVCYYLDNTDGVIRDNNNVDVVEELRFEFGQLRLQLDAQLNSMQTELKAMIRTQIKTGQFVVDGLDIEDDEAVDDVSDSFAMQMLNRMKS